MFDLANKVWGSLHDPETGAFIQGTPVRGADSKYFSSIERVGEGRFELSLAQKSAATGIEPGRMLVILARGGEVGGAHALAFMNCDPPVVEDCTVHASPAFPVFTKLCGEPIFRNVNVVPPEDGRPIASDADGIHVRNSVSGPTMEDCTVRRLEDDGFIVDTLMLTVSEIVDDNTVRVEELVGTYAEAGDVFDVMSPTGDLKGALSSVAEVTYYRQSERIPGRPETITFEEPIADAVSTGDFLANRSTSNRGFTIRNCTVENHRARGIRVTAGPGVIEDNTVRGSSGQGLLFECGTEGNWPPKRWAHDVTVRNNTISNSGMVWLSRDGSTGILTKHRTHTETTGYPHYGITVENNTIRNVATYGAKFADASDLTLRDNEFSRLNQLDFDNADYGVVLEHDDGVELTGNRVAGPTGSGDPVAFGLRRQSRNLSLTDNVLVTADGERPAELTQWVPLTFSFSHTVVPSENDPESTDDRHLAFMIREVTLLAGDGSTIRTLNVGRDEDGMQVGEGVYGPIANDEGSWRWLGGPNATATIFLRSNDLEAASTIEIRGNPVEAGVEADVTVDGAQVARLALGERTPQTYTIELDG
jgi:hypothetical protein